MSKQKAKFRDSVLEIGQTDVCKGWLKKRSSGKVFTNLKARYFRMSGHYLRYFLDEQTDTPRATFDLDQLVSCTSEGLTLHLRMVDGITLLLKAPTAADSEKWRLALQHCINEGGAATPGSEVVNQGAAAEPVQSAAENTPAAVTDAVLKKVDKVTEDLSQAVVKGEELHDQAEDAVDKFSEVLDFADAVLGAVGLVPLPGLGGLCKKLKGAIRAARQVRDGAQDALEAAERVLELGQWIVDVSKQAKRMKEGVKQPLEAQLAKLAELLGSMEEAMCTFGQKGWYRKMISVSKAAKKFTTIDGKVKRVVDAINRILGGAQLGLQLDMQERMYATEAAVWGQIDARVKDRGGDAADEDDVQVAAQSILADPAALVAVAREGGLDEDVFRSEMGEMKAELEKMGVRIDDLMQGYTTEVLRKIDAVAEQLVEDNRQLQLKMDEFLASSAEQGTQKVDQMMEVLQRLLLDRGNVDSGSAVEVQARTRLVEGAMHMQRGEDEQAAAAVKDAAALHTSATSEFARGVALTKKDGQWLPREEGQWAAAVEAFRAAVKLDSEMAGAWYSLGYATTAEGALGQAAGAEEGIKAYRQALRIDPRFTIAYTRLGDLLWGINGDREGAEKVYRAAVSCGPNDANAHIDLGGLLWNAWHNSDEAEAEYRTAITCDPNNAQAHYRLGRVLEDRDVWESDDSDSCFSDDASDDDSHEPDYDGAEAEYRAAIECDLEHAQAHYRLGRLLELQRQDHDGAEPEYRAAIEFDPTDAKAHWRLGLVRENQRQDYDGAEAGYREAIACDQQFPEPHCNLARLLENHRQDYGGAEESYRAAIACDLGTSGADAHLGLGNLLENKNDYRAAENSFRAAIKKAQVVGEQDATGQFRLGLLLQKQKKNPGALKAFQAAVACDLSDNDADRNAIAGAAGHLACAAAVAAAASAASAAGIAATKALSVLQKRIGTAKSAARHSKLGKDVIAAITADDAWDLQMAFHCWGWDKLSTKVDMAGGYAGETTGDKQAAGKRTTGMTVLAGVLGMAAGPVGAVAMATMAAGAGKVASTAQNVVADGARGGWNALDLAIKKDAKRCVKVLVEWGLDPHDDHEDYKRKVQEWEKSWQEQPGNWTRSGSGAGSFWAHLRV
jgi:tetratricopeptide (TPR) repeat protein